MFARIAIVGLGLIGGSIALAVRRRWPGTQIVAIDRAEAIEAALRLRCRRPRRRRPRARRRRRPDHARGAGPPERRGAARSLPPRFAATRSSPTSAAPSARSSRRRPRCRRVCASSAAIRSPAPPAAGSTPRAPISFATGRGSSRRAQTPRRRTSRRCRRSSPRSAPSRRRWTPDAHDRLHGLRQPSAAAHRQRADARRRRATPATTASRWPGRGLRDTTRLASSPRRHVARHRGDQRRQRSPPRSTTSPRCCSAEATAWTSGDESRRGCSSRPQRWKRTLERAGDGDAGDANVSRDDGTIGAAARRGCPASGIEVVRQDHPDPTLLAATSTPRSGEAYRWIDRLPWTDDEMPRLPRRSGRLAVADDRRRRARRLLRAAQGARRHRSRSSTSACCRSSPAAGSADTC